MTRLTRAFAVLLAAAALCACFAARADYPERLVKIVVPYPAGGGMDAVTRTIAAKLTENLGKPVVVENRGGGAGMIGIQAMTNAPADGYTLMTHALGFAVNPSIYRKLPYDAIGNIQPVAIVGFSPVYIAINPKLPAKNLQEFVELAKKRRMRGATFGFGASRLMIEELRFKGGFGVDFIPYNGAAPAILATIAGDTDFVMMDAPSVQQQIAAGKLRGLAVASEQRAPGLPDLPTTREAGMPGLVVDFWYAMFTRPGTPPEVLRKLNAEINKVTSTPDVAQRMNAIGIVPNHLDLAESSRFYLAEVDRWKGVVQKAKIEPVDQ